MGAYEWYLVTCLFVLTYAIMRFIISEAKSARNKKRFIVLIVLRVLAIAMAVTLTVIYRSWWSSVLSAALVISIFEVALDDPYDKNQQDVWTRLFK